MPASTITSEPGTTGTKRFNPMTPASDARPTASVSPSMDPRLVTTSQTCSKKSPEPFSIPSSLGTWPIMIVSARPTMKPLITGSEMKLARNPSRRMPARSAAMPVAIASAAVIATNSSPLGATRSATVAAESAAVADIGPTMRWRELPNAA